MAQPVVTITVWGDFTCPWSYLAWSRSEALADAGVTIDWRSVQHEKWRHLSQVEASDRFNELRDEVPEVLEHAMPGETLRHTFAGFVPFTTAATSAYAEAVAAGVDRPVRRHLFEAFWHNGVDLNSARVVGPLLVDDFYGSDSPSEQVRLWGRGVDVTGGPLSDEAWHLVNQWRQEWRDHGRVVPVAVITTTDAEGESRSTTYVGIEAVDRLGREMTARGLTPVDEDTLGDRSAA